MTYSQEIIALFGATAFLLVAGWPAIIVKGAYDSYKASRKELPEDKG